MASQILTQMKQKVSGLELVPAGGGCFEIDVDGKTLYSKLATGSFPNEADVLRDISKQG